MSIDKTVKICYTIKATLLNPYQDDEESMESSDRGLGLVLLQEETKKGAYAPFYFENVISS